MLTINDANKITRPRAKSRNRNVKSTDSQLEAVERQLNGSEEEKEV